MTESQKEAEAGSRSEEKVRASELSYRRLFESAKDGILILDAATGRVTDVNPFLIDLLGFSHSEVMGAELWELGPFRDIVANKDKFEQLQKRGYVRYDNLPLETKDGRKVAVEFVSNLYQAGNRDVIQCNIRDITERKRAEEQIRVLNAQLEQRAVESRAAEAQFIEAQKMEVIGQLASGVAHDFNNVLAVILGCSEFITLGLDPGSPLQTYVEEIRQASARAAGLTRQLMVFSRKQTLRPVVLDPDEVVRDLHKMLRRLIGADIEMTITPCKHTSRIRVDPGHLGQVLVNLVVNARDAMPSGGKLTIETTVVLLDENYARAHPGVIAGEYVMLSVSDTGTGITKEVQARLFEAFFTTKPLGKGTGLGLATCRTITQQSGGHIEFHSEVDEGTIFKVFFPQVEQPLEGPSSLLPLGPLPRGTETLLIVEDDPSLRDLAGRVLENQGYRVISASNGHDALRLAQENTGSPIRLVIADVIMPLMGGKVMAESLKINHPKLRILFTSSYTHNTISDNGALETGVEFLPKPYSPAALASKVRELLDNQNLLTS